jgi:CheY-like chemotaxis protein
MQKKFKRILLIDDDEINNELNRIILKKFGYAEETIIFESAVNALDYLKNLCGDGLPEVILLDIKMPVMDGFQFLEEAKNICNDFTKKVPVFMLTSSKNEGDIKKAHEYDIAGYLNKPLTTQTLDKIAEAI